MRPDVRLRLMREFRAIRRTGTHPDGRPLGGGLAPALDRIIAFLEEAPEADRPQQKLGALHRRALP